MPVSASAEHQLHPLRAERAMTRLGKDRITAVILAGGKGRRLQGQDKGLMNFNGKPVIEHIIERIQPQCSGIIINANRNLERYRQYGYPVVNDELEDFQGPLAGFAVGMQHADTDYVLTLPCDGPFVSPYLAERLSSALFNADAQLAVAHDGERMQPVHALIPVSMQRSLRQFLKSGERKIDRWYALHETALADFSDDPAVFDNINTMEQHHKLEKGQRA